MLWRKNNLSPEEVVRASAAEFAKSDSPYTRFTGRVALLEPIEFHRRDTILGGSLNGYSRWSFAYSEVANTERSIYRNVIRNLWVGKKTGQLMLTAQFFDFSFGVDYNGFLEYFPYNRRAYSSFHGFQDGLYLESLDHANQMVEDIEMGLMSQDHPTLQSYRSLAETYQGDDPEQKRILEAMATDAEETFYPGYDIRVREDSRRKLGWED